MDLEGELRKLVKSWAAMGKLSDDLTFTYCSETIDDLLKAKNKARQKKAKQHCRNCDAGTPHRNCG